MSKNVNLWEVDLRVSDRNIRNGVISEKDLEKHVSSLADLSEQCETVSLEQPALSAPTTEA